MAAASMMQAIYWTMLSQPACARGLYRYLSKGKPQRIVELGMGDGTRATRLALLTQRYGITDVQYTGIDLFESRTLGPKISLKQTHHQLAKTGIKVRLVPGEISSALARTANVLSGTDLVIVDAEQSDEVLQKMSHYFPRMMHEKTKIARFTGTAKQSLVWLEAQQFSNPKRRAA